MLYLKAADGIDSV